MLRVLLIEDNRDLAAMIWDFLEARDIVMDHALDGVSGLQQAMSGQHDVIILDLGLPRMDGLEVCRQLRAARRETPVLMLTARETLDDKLRGFAEGADDYLVKPFAMKELVARLHALHRRGQPLPNQRLVVADLEYDPESFRVRRGGTTVAVTHAGLRLLSLLMSSSPKVVSHAQMERALWGEAIGDPNAMRSHIHALRQAIDKPFATALLHSVHGIGYRLADDDAP